jgi:hypothetical protein
MWPSLPVDQKLSCLIRAFVMSGLKESAQAEGYVLLTLAAQALALGRRVSPGSQPTSPLIVRMCRLKQSCNSRTSRTPEIYRDAAIFDAYLGTS